VARVAVCQVAVAIDDPVASRVALLAAVASAVNDRADLVVLPELVGSGYLFEDSAEARTRAEPVDGPTVRLLRQLSAEHGLVLVAGWCEESGLDRPYNSAVLIEHGKLRAVYRKIHLWDREKLIFTPGAEPPPVVATALGAVAVMICYDLEFPELVRSAALRGAHLVATPANWPELPVPAGERPIEVVKAQAAAAVNHVAVAVADRCGPERGARWIGGSLICGPDGYLLAGPAQGEPTVLTAEIDLPASADRRLGEHNDALADRRPELYR
jgi:5-aminopentanamidase